MVIVHGLLSEKHTRKQYNVIDVQIVSFDRMDIGCVSGCSQVSVGVSVLVNLLVTDSCRKCLVFPLLTTPTHTPTGESWGHVCTIRLVLYWSGGERWAWLLKSPNRKEQTVSYQITVSYCHRHLQRYLEKLDSSNCNLSQECPISKRKVAFSSSK